MSGSKRGSKIEKKKAKTNKSLLNNAIYLQSECGERRVYKWLRDDDILFFISQVNYIINMNCPITFAFSICVSLC